MMGANPEKEYKTMFENGTFAVLGPDGKQVQCDVLFTYDCEDNGRSYVVFTTGEGAQQRLFANRYDTRDDGQLALLALENEQEYAIEGGHGFLIVRGAQGKARRAGRGDRRTGG